MTHAREVRHQPTPPFILLDALSELSVVGRESRQTRRAAEFIEAIEAGNERAIGIALSVISPRYRESPRMLMIPPRPMFLSRFVLAKAGHVGEQKLAAWRNHRARSGARDFVGESWLGM